MRRRTTIIVLLMLLLLVPGALLAQPQALDPFPLTPGQRLTFDHEACPTGYIVHADEPAVECIIDNQPTLVASYRMTTENYYDSLIYRPRQMQAGLTFTDTWGAWTVTDPGPYAGWDVLLTPNESVTRVNQEADWLRLHLNRPARVALIWRQGTLAPWLSGWTEGAPVTQSGRFSGAKRTFWRDVSVGELVLPGIHHGTTRTWAGDTYQVLIAEADGVPSAAPLTPLGQIEPQPNQTCPTWVHDQHTTIGPDGLTYPTWHPQIDPVYWCYYGHEHGSDPAFISPDYQPAYGYTASVHGMDEPHAGFKGYAVEGVDGSHWYLTHHFGTSGLGRVCTRFHTVDVVVTSADGTLLAELRFMADFGRAEAFVAETVLTPTACPDQGDVGSSFGVRKMKAADNPGGYEPWRIDDTGLLFGLNFETGFLFATESPILFCADSQYCDEGVQQSSGGAQRFLLGSLTLQAGTQTGEFWTDPTGRILIHEGDPHAIRQYVAPGASASAANISGKCRDVDGFGRPFHCGVSNTVGGNAERENSIPRGGPN